ncbi:hypothetical protein PSEUDO8AS_40010 [Pseudomonas sp. 8AS]|nr:hypothetical protein PSEUDO8AS_40010 [Pseudomonas sp. 8AS]
MGKSFSYINIVPFIRAESEGFRHAIGW